MGLCYSHGRSSARHREASRFGLGLAKLQAQSVAPLPGSVLQVNVTEK